MRTLCESLLYSKVLKALGNVDRIDDILTGLTWGISQHAEDWPVIQGTTKLRLAKSDLLPSVNGHYRFHVWFAIRDATTVDLLLIERIVIRY